MGPKITNSLFGSHFFECRKFKILYKMSATKLLLLVNINLKKLKFEYYILCVQTFILLKRYKTTTRKLTLEKLPFLKYFLVIDMEWSIDIRWIFKFIIFIVKIGSMKITFHR